MKQTTARLQYWAASTEFLPKNVHSSYWLVRDNHNISGLSFIGKEDRYLGGIYIRNDGSSTMITIGNHRNIPLTEFMMSWY